MLVVISLFPAAGPPASVARRCMLQNAVRCLNETHILLQRAIRTTSAACEQRAAAFADTTASTKPPLSQKVRFVDSIRIDVRGGKGGGGSSALFGRTGHHPRAAGGHGGPGGAVVLVGSPHIHSLGSLPTTAAGGSGSNGSKQWCAGARGVDTLLQVPLGTRVWKLLEYDAPSTPGVSPRHTPRRSAAQRRPAGSHTTRPPGQHLTPVPGPLGLTPDTSHVTALQQGQQVSGTPVLGQQPPAAAAAATPHPLGIQPPPPPTAPHPSSSHAVVAEEVLEEEEEEEEEGGQLLEDLLSCCRLLSDPEKQWLLATGCLPATTTNSSSSSCSRTAGAAGQKIQQQPAVLGDSGSELEEEEEDEEEEEEGASDADDLLQLEEVWGQQPRQLSKQQVWQVLQAQAQLLGEITQPGQQLAVAAGGGGGRGNSGATSKPYGPASRSREAGRAGQRVLLGLELVLLADAVLVGLPNVGKSSLLAALTGARAQVGSYAFTTLRPQLGALHPPAHPPSAHPTATGASPPSPGPGPGPSRVTLADVPGLVSGAAGGRGRGAAFLRHLGRAAALVWVVDASGGAAAVYRVPSSSRPDTPGEVPAAAAGGGLVAEGPVAQLAILQAEVAAYDPALLQLPALVVVNKMDAVGDPAQVLAALKAATPLPIIPVSAVHQAGLERLKEALLALVGSRAQPAAAA